MTKPCSSSRAGRNLSLRRTPFQTTAAESRQVRLRIEAADTGSTLDNISIFDKDEDRLMLTHFCDAANKPRFVGKLSPDGKTLEFDFLDVAGGTKYGYLQHVVFTIIDAEHHTEDWTYMAPGGKLVKGHMDLRLLK